MSVHGEESLMEGQKDDGYDPEAGEVVTGEGINAGIIFRMPVKDCEKKAAGALLGYLAMNVLDPPKGTTWGNFNDRPVDEPTVRKLVTKYKTDLVNCDEKTAMWAGVKKSWVKNLGEAKKTEELAGMYIHELPLLVLTPEAEKAILKEKLWFFSGNHRRTALEKYVDGLKKEAERTTVGTVPAEVDASHPMKEKIDMSSRWAVKLYDRGE
jgi:hypothetical protein